jgi:2-C-methyl-D-erythritol 4-phosphate cytidylyltransferase
MRYWVVMPAAGASRRFGGEQRKQYAPLAGRTVLELALEPFLADARCLGVALALAGDDLDAVAGSYRLDERIWLLAGGVRRCDSVLLGLEALAARAAADDWVLVHDAARPCLSRADLERLLIAGQGHAIGALLAAPVTDTIKQAGVQAPSAPVSERTVDRETLWRALTPQMFRYARLVAALRSAQAAGRAPTDEAQALEWQGEQALLVAARDSNIKITNAEDLIVAAALLSARADQQ